MKLIEYADADMMFIDLAQQIAGEMESMLFHDETVSLAVPGGTTPGPLFDNLSGADLAWERVFVLPTDERWVPEDNPRSNAGLIRDRLITGRAAAAQYLSLYEAASEPEETLNVVTGRVAKALPLSVLILGMGGDMHTASLFPGADRLDDALSNEAPPILPMRAPGAPEPRVTLTAPVLKAAMNTHILITGSEKRDAFERAQKSSAHDAPVAVVLGQATVHWAP
ncbi:MAG: 6-phosphogluconolactonase [Silicimonas sp.]|nr:6-phosphogluconolactonase [Silicimonas sp.]